MSTPGELPLSRRRFLEQGSAAAVGAALSGCAAASAAAAKGPMRYRRFGKTNLTVSEIGLGCATGLKSKMLGPERFNRYREELPAILHRLLDLGGNFVATGRGYHDTEQILGNAMKGRRHEVIIFTAPDPPKDNVETIIQCCEESLKNFHTDCIDCYFSHGRWSERFYEAALKLRQQGKIRFIGLSSHVPAEHRACVEAGQLDFVFQPYNYMALAKWTERFDRNDVEGLFAFCKQKDVGVISMKPMTGHFLPNWAKDTSNPKVASLMSELSGLGAEHLYHAMLLWVLKNPNVCCAAVGMSAVGEVAENCRAVGMPLTRAHERLLEHYAAACTDDYCRLCETCLPSCPAGIRIPDILRYRMYYKNYGHREDARELYAAVPADRQATACTECGACEGTCPNKLAIRNKLREAHTLLV
ncbi:MAG: aldo/keto reductase [Pirellulales bacterium]|nr:aldo/keto reductase [Pirellulales bacterium]